MGMRHLQAGARPRVRLRQPRGVRTTATPGFPAQLQYFGPNGTQRWRQAAQIASALSPAVDVRT